MVDFMTSQLVRKQPQMHGKLKGRSKKILRKRKPMQPLIIAYNP